MKNRIINIATVLIIVSFFSFSYISTGSITLAPTSIHNSEVRMWIERNKKKYSIPMYNSYCILFPKPDSGYTFYLLKYIFQSRKVSSIIVKSVDELNSISSNYIFIYDKENAIINTWIKDMYPEQLGNDVIIHNKKGKK